MKEPRRIELSGACTVDGRYFGELFIQAVYAKALEFDRAGNQRLATACLIVAMNVSHEICPNPEEDP